MPFSQRSLWITRHDSRWVSPFGCLRIYACLQLPEAFRCLPRPSSALCAKASTVCPSLFPSFAFPYLPLLTLTYLGYKLNEAHLAVRRSFYLLSLLSSSYFLFLLLVSSDLFFSPVSFGLFASLLLQIVTKCYVMLHFG